MLIIRTPNSSCVLASTSGTTVVVAYGHWAGSRTRIAYGVALKEKARVAELVRTGTEGEPWAARRGAGGEAPKASAAAKARADREVAADGRRRVNFFL
jgi:hypothetical protein